MHHAQNQEGIGSSKSDYPEKEAMQNHNKAPLFFSTLPFGLTDYWLPLDWFLSEYRLVFD